MKKITIQGNTLVHDSGYPDISLDQIIGVWLDPFFKDRDKSISRLILHCTLGLLGDDYEEME